MYAYCSSEATILPKCNKLNLLSDALQHCIELLKQKQTDEIYIENWKRTATYRAYKLKKKVYESYAMFLAEFPIVQEPIGLKLVIVHL